MIPWQFNAISLPFGVSQKKLQTGKKELVISVLNRTNKLKVQIKDCIR